MPNRLRKQTKLRAQLGQYDRICKRGFHRDVAIVLNVGKPGTPHLIKFWQNGPDKTDDSDAYRLVYRNTTPFQPIDQYNKRCFYEADIYPPSGGAPIGELRVRRWYVGNKPDSSILYTVALNGAIVYQAPGL